MDMPVDAFLTTLYCIVDDWYQAEGVSWLKSKPGVRPTFSDSEVLTLSLAQHFLGFASERDFLRFIRNNYHPLFPQLVSQSQFNTRARNLCWLLRRLQASLRSELLAAALPRRLIDSTPIHVRHWRRYGPRSLALPGAALGYCAAKREAFYGYRLVLLTTFEGVIADWVLIPANANERDGALDLLEETQALCVLGDTGFLDQQRQAWLQEERGICLLTPKRKNQKEQLPRAWVQELNRLRQRIETTYSQAKAWFGLEQPRAKTFWGLVSRLIAKLTGMTLAAHANLAQGYSPLRLAGFSF